MNNQRRNKVLIIHDNRMGHLNPSIAVSEMIEKRFYLQGELFQIPFLSKRLVSLFKKLSNFPRLYTAAARLIFKCPIPNLDHTDVIVCSGMPNLIYAAYLSQKFHIPLIYVGGTRKFNANLIDWIINVIPEPNIDHQITIPTTPVRRIITDLAQLPSNHEVCLLLGGTTHEHPFTSQEFIQIIKNFIQFTQQHNIQGTIVSSRRTPESVITYIQTSITSEINFVNQNSKIPIHEVLEKSDYIFVTEDSVTMLSEAIQTGRATISICCENTATDQMIKQYIDLKFIQRKSINQLATAEYKPSQLQPYFIEQIITQQLAQDLKAKSKNLSFYQSHMSKLKML